MKFSGKQSILFKGLSAWEFYINRQVQQGHLMKKKLIITAILLALFCLPHPGMTQPGLLIKDPVYTFKMVPEGTLVPHEFIVKNTGDTLLHIENVLPP